MLTVNRLRLLLLSLMLMSDNGQSEIARLCGGFLVPVRPF